MKKGRYYNNQLKGIDDESVIDSILGGQTEQFSILVDRYADEVMHTVGRIIHSPEDAEEVVQDTFVAVFQALASFDSGKASFKTWLMRIAYYTSLKRLRGISTTAHAEADTVSIDTITDTDADMVLNDTSPRRLSLLAEAIRMLPAKDQMLLSLYYHDDRPIKEIAFIIGCTDSYLRSRLQWLRKKLCQTIKKLEQNGNE